MTQMGDNDDLVFMLMDGDTGNAVDAVGWKDARERIADFLMANTSSPGWAANQAETILTAMTTGRSA